MSKNINFEVGTIVTDTFLDSLQELLTGTINNLSLGTSISADRVALNLSGDYAYDGLGTINIGGKYCFIDQSRDSDPASPSGSGVRSIYVSTNSNNSPIEPNFSLTISASAPTDAYIRKIGEVYSSSGVLSNAKMITGVQADHEQYNSFTFRSILDTAEETMLTLSGQSTQTSDPGVFDSAVSDTPAKALKIDKEGDEKLYIDTAGRIVLVDTGSGDGDAAIQFTNHSGSSVITTNKEVSSHIAGADQPSFSTREIDTDSENRLTITNSGTLEWGDGSNPSDVAVYRTDIGIISLDAGNKLQQNAAPTVGDDLTNKTYVDSATNISLDGLNDVTISTPLEGHLLRFDTPANEWVNTGTITIDDNGRLHINTDNALAGLSFGDDSGYEATITWKQDNTLEFTGRTVTTGTSNLSSAYLENNFAPVVGDTYDIQLPTDNVLLCKPTTGDIFIRLSNTDAVDGDIITVKDADGGASFNDLALIANGVRKRNVPVLTLAAVTGTIAGPPTTVTLGGVGVDEVQNILITGAGTFELTFDGQTTAATLTESSTAADVRNAINSLSPHPQYGDFSVSCAGTDVSTGSGVTVTFNGGSLVDGEAAFYIAPWESVRVIYKDSGTYGEWFVI